MTPFSELSNYLKALQIIRLKGGVLYASSQPTDALVLHAVVAVSTSLAGCTIPPDPVSLCDGQVQIIIKLDQLLLSMMKFAISNSAKRYTASVIITAHKKGLLRDVAKAWLLHLFYPIKACNDKQNREYAPSIERYLLLHPLMKRQQYRCAITQILGRTRTDGWTCTIFDVLLLIPDVRVEMFDGVPAVVNPDLTMQMLKDWGFDTTHDTSYDAFYMKTCVADLDYDLGYDFNYNAADYNPYRPENSILVKHNLHRWLATYAMKILQGPTEDKFKMLYPEEDYHNHSDDVEEFSFSAQHGVPPPNLSNLKLHAAFCNVFHRSGAGSHFEWMGLPDELSSLLTENLMD